MAALVVPSVSARGRAVRVDTAAPAIGYPRGIGNLLTMARGTWSSAPTSFTYQWLRCPRDPGAASWSGCLAPHAPEATAAPVLMDPVDEGST